MPTSASLDLAAAESAFAGYLRNVGARPGIRRSYAIDVMSFVDFLQREGVSSIAGIDQGVLDRYERSVRDGVAEYGQAELRLIAAAQGFATWAEAASRPIDGPATRLVDVTQSLPTLRHDLVNAGRATTATQDALACALLVRCGLRVFEICALNISDVVFERRRVAIRVRGRGPRLVPVDKRTAPMLRHWWRVRRDLVGQTGDMPLFARGTRRLDRRSAVTIVRALEPIARIERIDAGLLREAFAVVALRTSIQEAPPTSV